MNLLKDALAYARRGWAIIPMRFKNGEKHPAVRWKQYQQAAPGEHLLEKWFTDGKYAALAVILGPVSDNLCCRDFDDVLAYHRWAKKHPELAKTLPTAKTGRGYHVYFVSPLTKTEDQEDGELRAGMALCILPPSEHPSGKRYGWTVPLPDGPVPEIDPAEAGLMEAPVRQKRTEVDGCNGRARKTTDRNRRGLKAVGVGDQIALAITVTQPDGPGMRHRKVFHLARALKGIPELADLDVDELRPVVEEWHKRALPYINTREFDETWIDFIAAWSRVKVPMRLDLREEVMQAVRANPVESLPYDSQGVRDLVAVCRELQAMWGEQPFFLAVRTAGRWLGVDKDKASGWLKLLVHDGWIVTVKKGGTPENPRRATRFRFTGAGRTANDAACGKNGN